MPATAAAELSMVWPGIPRVALLSQDGPRFETGQQPAMSGTGVTQVTRATDHGNGMATLAKRTDI